MVAIGMAALALVIAAGLAARLMLPGPPQSSGGDDRRLSSPAPRLKARASSAT